jgi:hypothetical protein
VRVHLEISWPAHPPGFIGAAIRIWADGAGPPLPPPALEPPARERRHGSARPVSLPADFHPELMCGLLRAAYTPRTRTAKLHLPPGECAHGPGAITLSTRLYPGVRRIQTLAGRDPDTDYRLIDGEWHAFWPDAMRRRLARVPRYRGGAS